MILVSTSVEHGRKVWVLDGREVTSYELNANPSTGILAEESLNLQDTPLDQLKDRILEVAREVGRTTTKHASFLHIAWKNHRKEVALNLAVEQAEDEECKFPDGNQKVFDCWFKEKSTQTKTEQGGQIPLHHNVNGEEHCAYSHSDPIDQFLGGSLWKSNGAYWVVYAWLPMWRAVKQQLVDAGPENPARDKSVTFRYGDLGPWLVGGRALHPDPTDWTSRRAYGWKVAKVQPTERLPDWLLEDTSTQVADESKEPSEAKCLSISAKVDRGIAAEEAERVSMLAKAAIRSEKRTREEADRAEAAADRAEAAGAGPSTVNNITNNFNFHAPPSKRLLTDFFSLQ